MTQEQSGSQGGFEAITNISLLERSLDTSLVFIRDYVEESLSPIDQYIKNSNKINLVWMNEDVISAEFSSILLLGYISAVESYMRSLIRCVINIDPTSQFAVESKTISFAAAVYHKRSIMPEALLEDVSFVGSEHITKSLNSFLLVPPQKMKNMQSLFEEFDKISQLRHCCTHRFGKLGTKNAMALGLSNHTDLLEKPLHLSKEELGFVAASLRNLIKSLNNNVYRVLLERTVPGKSFLAV